MTAVKENLKYLRLQNGLSQSALADALNIKRTALNAWETGRANPKYETAKAIADYFSVSPETLLFGSAKESAVEESRKLPALQVLAITVDNEDRENIEYVPIKAFAGYATGYGDPDYIKELPRFRLPFLGNGTYRAFEIEGDSMLPIVSGSVVIGQYVENPNRLKAGDVYVVVTMNSGILFKRVAKMEKERIHLKSDNPHFYSYSLPVSEIKEAWKAKLYMSYQFPEN